MTRFRAGAGESGRSGVGLGLELEAFHGRLALLEEELLLLQVHGRGQCRVLVLRAEVALDQVEGLLVDLLVRMALQELQLIKAYGRDK